VLKQVRVFFISMCIYWVVEALIGLQVKQTMRLLTK
jgi:hypothetical protein